MLTLKAAGLVDIDAGEIVRPGILRVEDDRIAGVGGSAGSDGEVIDLGDLILLPGLMDMEVNLLMGVPTTALADQMDVLCSGCSARRGRRRRCSTTCCCAPRGGRRAAPCRCRTRAGRG